MQIGRPAGLRTMGSEPARKRYTFKVFDAKAIWMVMLAGSLPIRTLSRSGPLELRKTAVVPAGFGNWKLWRLRQAFQTGAKPDARTRSPAEGCEPRPGSDFGEHGMPGQRAQRG
jgi:hypothetical protein